MCACSDESSRINDCCLGVVVVGGGEDASPSSSSSGVGTEEEEEDEEEEDEEEYMQEDAKVVEENDVLVLDMGFTTIAVHVAGVERDGCTPTMAKDQTTTPLLV
jgi:hypothetical protein